MLRLSFIVPFYNVEPYIEECIRSLYNQDISQEEYEVICVDDCSLDGSRAIVERLQKEYPTLKLLIHTENKRQGGARNTGMKVAQGKYIWFIDSDDYIKPNSLKGMIELAEKENLDILKFYFDSNKNVKQNDLLRSTSITSGSHIIYDIQNDIPLLVRCCSACQQLIRKEFLIEHSISFAEGVQYEDDDYAYQLYAYAERAYLIASAPYMVRQTPNSTTRRQNDIRRIRDIYAQAIRMQELDAKLSNIDERWHIMINKCIDDSINNCVLPMLKCCSFSEQLLFLQIDRKQAWKLKPYLSRKSYVKLSSYIMWKLLQK